MMFTAQCDWCPETEYISRASKAAMGLPEVDPSLPKVEVAIVGSNYRTCLRVASSASHTRRDRSTRTSVIV